MRFRANIISPIRNKTHSLLPIYSFQGVPPPLLMGVPVNSIIILKFLSQALLARHFWQALLAIKEWHIRRDNPVPLGISLHLMGCDSSLITNKNTYGVTLIRCWFIISSKRI
jgi:hypothetical protein